MVDAKYLFLERWKYFKKITFLWFSYMYFENAFLTFLQTTSIPFVKQCGIPQYNGWCFIMFALLAKNLLFYTRSTSWVGSLLSLTISCIQNLSASFTEKCSYCNWKIIPGSGQANKLLAPHKLAVLKLKAFSLRKIHRFDCVHKQVHL